MKKTEDYLLSRSSHNTRKDPYFLKLIESRNIPGSWIHTDFWEKLQDSNLSSEIYIGTHVVIIRRLFGKAEH